MAFLLLFPALVAMGGVGRASSLPDDYWHRSLALQGKAPAAWGAPERSLAPEACGSCHAGVFADWQTSLHAKALSPGLVGQLLTYSATDTQVCLNCHAPLAEQAAAFERARAKGQAHRPQAQGLAAAGNGCAGCHVREHRRFGPPHRETGKDGLDSVNGAHGGVMRTKDFERSDFCAGCHQFPQSQAINGKPLENTVEEWRQSSHAAAGRTCQSCHMPDRRHLWRGIHDPAMVASGVKPDFLANAREARFTLTNTGVGHAFPTYVTPKVIMHAVLLDGTGRPVADSARSHVIERQVVYENEAWREISDTRLLPGESASVAIPWDDARLARVWLEIRPDEYYHAVVYAGLLETLPEGETRRLITEADARAQASAYVLFETVLERNGSKAGEPSR